MKKPLPAFLQKGNKEGKTPMKGKGDCKCPPAKKADGGKMKGKKC